MLRSVIKCLKESYKDKYRRINAASSTQSSIGVAEENNMFLRFLSNEDSCSAFMNYLCTEFRYLDHHSVSCRESSDHLRVWFSSENLIFVCRVKELMDHFSCEIHSKQFFTAAENIYDTFLKKGAPLEGMILPHTCYLVLRVISPSLY